VSFPTLALNLAAALVLAAVMVAAGARARRLARLPLPRGLRFPAELLVGAWLLGGAVLLLGLAGLLRPWTVAAVTVLLAIAGRWRRLPRLDTAAAPLAGTVLLLPVALAPPFFYDALVYHLALPWQMLQEGAVRAHGEDLFSTFPPLAQLVAAPPLAFGLDRVPALLHAVAVVAAGAALVALARGLGAPRRLAALAGFCLPLLPGHALVPGLPAAEGWTAAAVATALAVALARHLRPRTAALAGLLAGIGVAARLQGLAWAAGVVVVTSLRARRRVAAGAAALAAVAAGAAPWWLKNAVLLGDPLAPVGWRREGVETLWRDAGSLAAAAPTPGAVVAQLAGALPPLVSYLAPLALAAVLVVARSRDRRRWWLAAAVAGGTLAWATSGVLPRFLMPTELVLLGLVATAPTRAARWASGLALGSAAALGLAVNGAELARLARLDAFRAPAAGVARQLVVNDPAPAFAAAHGLPAGSRALFVGEARGFAFPHRFAAPSQHDVSPLREPLERGGAAAARAWLQAADFTHLVVNRGELARLAPAYPVAPWRSPEGHRQFAALLRELGPPVVAVHGVEVYALTKP
jgi:hypothetical protein